MVDKNEKAVLKLREIKGFLVEYLNLFESKLDIKVLRAKADEDFLLNMKNLNKMKINRVNCPGLRILLLLVGDIYSVYLVRTKGESLFVDKVNYIEAYSLSTAHVEPCGFIIHCVGFTVDMDAKCNYIEFIDERAPEVYKFI